MSRNIGPLRKNCFLAIVGALGLLIALVMAGCGSNDQAALNKALNEDKAETAAEAKLQTQNRQLEQQIVSLGKEIINLKTSAANNAASSNSQLGPQVPSDINYACGGGLWVNSVTSCPFASNVRSSYYSSDSTAVSAYSPVTGEYYLMYCTPDSPHVCTGGDDAEVYFP